jgi:hypothetical protein
MRVQAHTFDARTTLALIVLVPGLLVPFPVPHFAELFHALILLRVLPPCLISQSDPLLVSLVTGPGLLLLSIEHL